MAGDLLGVVQPGSQWQFNLDADVAAEVDRTYGLAGDVYVAGKWTKGLAGDHPGVVRYNPGDRLLHWYLDTDGSPVHEIDQAFGLLGDIPVVGDWDGDGVDDVGVVRQGSDGLLKWYLNLDRDPMHEKEFTFGLPGDIPVVGDWDGNGIDDIGTVRRGADGLLHWFKNLDNDPTHDLPIVRFGLPGDIPVVGDWNIDNKSDVGVVRSGYSDGLLRWYLDTDGDPTHEIERVFGRNGDVPVTGVWRMSEVAVDGITSGQTTAQDFGLLRQGQAAPAVRTFVVCNTGNATLQLGSAVAPAGFRITTQPKATLAPTESTSLVVRLESVTIGVKTGQIQFTTNDGNESPFRISVRGVVALPEIAVFSIGQPLNPNSSGEFSLQSNIGRVLLAESVRGYEGSRRTLLVRNEGMYELKVNSVSVTGGFELVQGLPNTIRPGGSATMIVRMKTATVGAAIGSVRIVSDDADESTFSIALGGNVALPAPRLSLFNASGGNLDFGVPTQGDPEPVRTYVVKNTGNTPLRITSTSASGWFSVTRPSNEFLAVGAETTIAVRMKTDAIGSSSDNVRIETDLLQPVVFIVSGRVIAPVPQAVLLDANGANVDFGSSYEGDTIRRTYTFKNTGRVPVHISGVTASGGFSVVQQPVSILRVGEETKFIIRLDSSKAGTFNGTVQLSTNLPQRTLAFNVSGVVQARIPVLEIRDANGNNVTGQSLALKLHTGTTTKVQFQIFNRGQAILTTSRLVVPEGMRVLNLPPSIAPGGSAGFAIEIIRVGFHRGTLSFATNDAGGGSFSAAITGRVLPPTTYTQFGDSPAPRLPGPATFYQSAPIARIEINRQFGLVHSSTRYIVEMYSANGSLVGTTPFSGSLTRLDFYLINVPVIENYTNISTRVFINNRQV